MRLFGTFGDCWFYDQNISACGRTLNSHLHSFILPYIETSYLKWNLRGNDALLLLSFSKQSSTRLRVPLTSGQLHLPSLPTPPTKKTTDSQSTRNIITLLRDFRRFLKNERLNCNEIGRPLLTFSVETLVFITTVLTSSVPRGPSVN